MRASRRGRGALWGGGLPACLAVAGAGTCSGCCGYGVRAWCSAEAEAGDGTAEITMSEAAGWRRLGHSIRCRGDGDRVASRVPHSECMQGRETDLLRQGTNPARIGCRGGCYAPCRAVCRWRVSVIHWRTLVVHTSTYNSTCHLVLGGEDSYQLPRSPDAQESQRAPESTRSQAWPRRRDGSLQPVVLLPSSCFCPLAGQIVGPCTATSAAGGRKQLSSGQQPR